MLALPAPIAFRPTLPVLSVVRPAWSSSDESWRADKPFKPWFQSPVPCAVAVAVGAISLDLTALGLGVPEIFPTHQPYYDDKAAHDHAHGLAGEPDLAALAPSLFDADEGFGIDLAAWDKSDFIVPSWQHPHEAGHDWWA